MKLRDPLKEKCLYITVNFDPFDSKVFAHFNCYWGPGLSPEFSSEGRGQETDGGAKHQKGGPHFHIFIIQ